MTERTRRTNDEWLAELRADGPASAAAHDALRELVATAVRKTTADRRGIDASVLDDLIQIATVKVLENLDRFEGRSQFTTWAWSVAIRAAFSELRKPGWRQTVDLETAAAADLPSSAPQPARWAERNEIVAVMHRVIAEELTERQRTAILGELEGTPQQELLVRLGASRGTFYKLVHDARRKLRQGLTAAGICDDQVREAFDL